MAKRVKDWAQDAVPQTDDAANAAVAEIGRLQRAQTEFKTKMDDELEAVRARYADDLRLVSDAIKAKAKGLQTWCEANRAKLTDNGKVKTHRFLAGEVSWRNRPPKVSIRGVQAVLDKLVDLGLTQFIRTNQDIDKAAMLKDPEKAAAVDGVSIGSAGEDFVIKPNETDQEAIA
ncbi:MAG: host-nuclease inhibitor Gam family protein [Alphaproteobacteria bacterium]|nr:host-nuclease inhibitor Gam family protein [Alphaproteobacteria bacterium]